MSEALRGYATGGPSHLSVRPRCPYLQSKSSPLHPLHRRPQAPPIHWQKQSEYYCWCTRASLGAAMSILARLNCWRRSLQARRKARRRANLNAQYDLRTEKGLSPTRLRPRGERFRTTSHQPHLPLPPSCACRLLRDAPRTGRATGTSARTPGRQRPPTSRATTAKTGHTYGDTIGAGNSPSERKRTSIEPLETRSIVHVSGVCQL